MKTAITISLLYFFFFLNTTLSAQQVKETGTKNEMPLKTVVVKDAGSDDLAQYFATHTIIRFWVYKAGSVRDVTGLLKTLRSTAGVEKITEGELNGDYKEFILTVKEPQDLNWYKKTFNAAGLSHIRINKKGAVPLSEM